MAMPIVILAHGALGGLDEVIFVSIALVFVAMMGLSWYRSQQLADDPDQAEDQKTETVATDKAPTDDLEHFELK